jgi:hypothetical protein
MTPRAAVYFLIILFSAAFSSAQESPYFVTYDHHMEEPGNLEVETFSTVGVPRSGPRAYFAPYMEMEYGITAKWTSELYLEAQSTRGDSTVFTGWRLENRFRPLSREHWINPVLYLEYENLNEASRIQKEIVGSGPEFAEPNSELRHTRAHELETKLILSSNTHDWNFAENFTVEKNLSQNEGFEFGYSFAFSRPLGTLASGKQCRFCRENFAAGAEFYGGLGSTNGFGVRGNPHYLAPVIVWQISDNASLHFSPGFGLNHESNRVLFRFGYSYEIRGFGSRMARLFGAKP